MAHDILIVDDEADIRLLIAGILRDEGYQTRAGGLVESKRGTINATYLYYTLGKLQILKLRADLEKKEGAQFSLQQFHDDFLKQGFPPIKIVRRALLGDTSPTL